MRKILILMLLFMAVSLFAQNTPLTLLSPNGGEVWQQGITHPITWQQINLAGSVTLQLLSNSTNQAITIGQNIPVEAGVFQWTIPNSVVPANYYRVRISLANDPATSFSDISNAPFSITGSAPPPPPQQFIQVLTPNGGENWQRGETYPIAWTSAGLEGEVRISLVQDNGTADIQIATNVPINSGIYNWTIPATIPSGYGYRVHIVWLSLLTVYFGDFSDAAFSIVDANPPPPPGLTITSPNGGETWIKGTTQTITWLDNSATDINPGVVNIWLVKVHSNHRLRHIIAHNVPNTGSFSWTVPLRLPTGFGYRVLIRKPNSPQCFDLSDAPFSIVGQIAQLDVSPNPAREKVAISVEAKASIKAEISIFNLKGQLVRRLSNTIIPNGKSSIEWDGRDANGNKVHSGIYLIRVSDGSEVITKRIVMLK